MHAVLERESGVKAAGLTGVERRLGADEIIVSKTDPKGRITYANRTFLKIAGYREDEVMGKPHNLVRHPEMPRCVFRFLWETIQDGREVFAYVLNRAKNGDHYWVLAHVTATYDACGTIVGYHSNRRSPSRSAIDQIRRVYDVLLVEERKHRLPREQWEASLKVFTQFLADRKMSYDEFIFTLM